MWLQSFDSDSGLLGEGVLQMLALAKQQVLTEDAILMPAAHQALDFTAHGRYVSAGL